MSESEFLIALLSASTFADAQSALNEFLSSAPDAGWHPVGNRENNRGVIEVSGDPGKSANERVTNAIDAVLEREHDVHVGLPKCRSPREAAVAWLGVPRDGLSKMTPSDRRDLAKRVIITVGQGDGKAGRLLEIRDFGIGLSANDMPRTILSLNENNKMSKHYLAGAYGQGGSSTFVSSLLTLIASRRCESDEVAFTIVKYRDLPPEQYKTGQYVYLQLDAQTLRVPASAIDFEVGTLVRHFNYDLSSYNAALGPGSVYGLLNKSLFDPIMPVWLDDRVHKYRRVIKGSRNALNGATDEGDDARTPSLSHRMPMLYVPLGDFGQIGIEYWVLDKVTKTNREPTAAFVNPNRPIVFTLNGQAQEELTSLLIRKDAELPYLAKRTICHVDCNNLEPAALRSLFVSNREGARPGTLLDIIKKEVVNALRSDDELIRLNTEAKLESLRERDETAVLEARKAVAKMLHLHGLDISEPIGATASQNGRPSSPDNRRARGKTGAKPPEPIEIHEPPAYISIVWIESDEITFYAGQRRYIRIETDAESQYHNPSNPYASRINFILSNDEVKLRSTTALQNGRMRAVFDCPLGAREGGKGTMRVELSRLGLASLTDERTFEIVAAPASKDDAKKITLPPFDIDAVHKADETWEQLDWPDDVAAVASSANLSDGTIIVYYNFDFPAFRARYNALELRNPALAEAFKRRYEIWLVVHSLILQQQQTECANPQTDAEEGRSAEDNERLERIRVGTLSAMMAAKEVETEQQVDADVILN